MIQESCQDNFRSCLRNFLSGARKKNIKDMSKPFSKIFLRTVPHPVQKMLPYLYWNIFHEKESGTSYQHTVCGKALWGVPTLWDCGPHCEFGPQKSVALPVGRVKAYKREMSPKREFPDSRKQANGRADVGG